MYDDIIRLTKDRQTCYNKPPENAHLDSSISDDGRNGDIMRTSVSVMDFVRYWLETIKKTEVKESTYDRLISSVETLSDYPIASIAIDELTTIDFQSYVNSLIEQGYSHSTIKKQVRIVSAPFNYAYNQRIIAFDPCKAVKIPARSRARKKERDVAAYSPEEQDAIRPILRRHDRPGYRLIELMLETGLRPGEALALDWDDVSIVRQRLRVHATVINLANRRISKVQEGAKSQSSNRVVPLSKRASEILSDLKSISAYDFVFENNGERLTYEALRYQCQQACKEAKIAYKGLHVWRHTFATNQYYKGTDVKILSKILGHADASITYDTYINLYGDGFDDMLKAVT